MSLRLALAIIIPLFASASSTSAQQFLGPAQFCGVATYAAPNPMGASATIWQGQPVIIIDQSNFLNPAWATFVLAHECAHHVIGHSLPQGMWFRSGTFWGTRAQELQADCWAAQMVGPQIAQQVAATFAQTQGPFSPGMGYPTGNERASNILRCAGLG